MEQVLKQERTQIHFGNVKRMTAAEHSLRVKFDYNLIDQMIPNGGFKRIYPLDPNQSNYSTNGDDLEEVYTKLEKTS